MDIEELLSAVAESVGLKELKLDSNGSCAMVFDGSLQIDFHYSEIDRTLHMGGVLGTIPGGQRKLTIAELLAANCDPAQLGECHFALDAVRSEIILCRTLLPHEQDRSLPTQVELLVNACKSWRESLRIRQLLIA